MCVSQGVLLLLLLLVGSLVDCGRSKLGQHDMKFLFLKGAGPLATITVVVAAQLNAKFSFSFAVGATRKRGRPT